MRHDFAPASPGCVVSTFKQVVPVSTELFLSPSFRAAQYVDLCADLLSPGVSYVGPQEVSRTGCFDVLFQNDMQEIWPE